VHEISVSRGESVDWEELFIAMAFRASTRMDVWAGYIMAEIGAVYERYQY
jgi:hypothetical protein